MSLKKSNNHLIFIYIFLKNICKNNYVWVFFLLFVVFKSNANNILIEKKLEPIISFDEVPISFLVNGYLRFETDVIITESNLVYVNIEDLFKNLGISCKSENQGDLLVGFIENENKIYSINFNERQINIENKTINSENGIVKELGSIYIESSIIAEAFGLTMIFNYRSLSIKLESNFELPLVKQMRLAEMRKNILKLQDKEIIADTLIKRDYHLFKFGMLDWTLESHQTKNRKPNNRVNVGLGTELLFGQANVSINYNDQYKFNNRDLYYNWRWVDNDNNYLKQAQLGKIFSQSISFLEAPVVGVSINNSPNTVRKARGFHTINEYTEPNWTVELYINDALVDYTVADASGLYVFKVPIVYGYTILKLKFYGPLGEERIEERTMNVPFTFVPAKTFEYSASGGVLEDEKNSKFGSGVVNYGLNRFLTIGAGVEYLSSIPENPLIPFASLAFQPFSRLILNLEYAHNVRMKGLLNYNLGKSIFLEIDYANYVDGQLATRFNANEERKIKVTLPYKMNKISGYAKLNFNTYNYDAFDFNQIDAVFSGYYKNYNANVSTLLNWIGDKSAFISTNASLSYRMRNGLVFRPSAEFNISDNQLLRYKAEIEKRVSKMYFSASYERSVQYKSNNVFLNFRYDLPFARTGFSSSYINNQFNFSENAQGSLAFGADNGVITTDNNSALGKGGILLYPFLDLNQNGKRDAHEPLAFVDKVKVTGGKAITSEKDSIVRISDLNAFINYTVEFSNENLENIAWSFKHKTYQILVDPNQYKKVDIPILVMGEVNGMVSLNLNNEKKGQGRMTIQIFNNKLQKVAETLTESNGYFNYLGLKPGEYTLTIDPQQLKKLNFQSMPNNHSFRIRILEEGDIVTGLDFVLNSTDLKSNLEIKSDTIVSINSLNQKSNIEPLTNEVVEGINQNRLKDIPSLKNIAKINGSFFSVQIGVFKEMKTLKNLADLYPIYFEEMPNNTYRYLYGNFETLNDAIKAKNNVVSKGIKDAFVVAYINGKKTSVSELVKLKK